MATKTSTLKLVIAGDNKSAVKAVQGTEQALGGLQGKLGGLGAGLAGAFSVGAVAAFGKASVTAYSTIAGSVAQIKRLTGESAEDSSLLAFAAQQSGIDANKAAVGWRTLAKNIDSGKVAAAGIATKDTAGNLLSFEQILGNVADKIQALPPGYQRTALAQQLFGRSGAELVKVLQNGSKGIEDLRSEMQSYGLEFNNAGLKKYQDFVQAQRDMKAAMSGLQVEVAEHVVPALTAAADAIAWFGRLPAPLKDTALAMGGLAFAVGGLATAVGFLGPALTNGLRTIKLMPAAEAEAGAGMTTLATATLAATAGIASFAATTALLDNLSKFKGDAEDLGTSLQDVGDGTGSIEAVAEAAGTSIDGLAGKFRQASDAPKDWKDALGDIFSKGSEIVDVRQAQNTIKAVDDQLAELVKSGHAAQAKAAYDDLVKSLVAQGLAYDQIIPLLPKYTVAQDKASTSTGNAANRQEELTASIKKANDAVAGRRSTLEAQRSASKGLADASDAVAKATADEAEAQRAAKGDSDEYRNATQAVADAERDVADAQSGVVDAQESAASAVRDLADARAKAVAGLADLARAEHDAGRAQSDAVEKQRDAAIELRRVLADGKSSDEDKHDAKVALANATDDVTLAEQDHQSATDKLNEAQRAGVEGDREVVDAKRKVADANGAVRDAEDKVRQAVKKVSDAQAAARKVIVDAKAAVVDASNKTRDAQLDEADAVGKVGDAYGGATAGVAFQIAALEKLRDTVAPGSPLRTYLDQYIAQLLVVLNPNTSGVGSLGPSAPPGARNAEIQGGRSSGLQANQTLGGSSVTQNIQITVPTRSSGRAVSDMARKELDRIARGGR